jgi:hypothetical protein
MCEKRLTVPDAEPDAVKKLSVCDMSFFTSASPSPCCVKRRSF